MRWGPPLIILLLGSCSDFHSTGETYELASNARSLAGAAADAVDQQAVEIRDLKSRVGALESQVAGLRTSLSTLTETVDTNARIYNRNIRSGGR